MKISVILPTYNEKENIVELIKEIQNQFRKASYDSYEILVMDDNSPDQTAQIVQDYSTSVGDERIRAVVRTENKGLAPSVLEGIRTAKGDWVLIMDSDFNHDPSYIPIFISNSHHFDIIIGSRYVTGGGMLTSQFRYWGSYFFNQFIKFVLLVQTNDNLSGFFMLRKNEIEKLDLDQIVTGYGDYAIRLLFNAKLQKMKILEIPVVYKFRLGGSSKTNFWVYTWLYAKTVFQLRLASWFGKKTG